MVPCHTASLMVKLKVKHMVRLYVMVCLPVVSTGRVVSATPASVVPFSPRDSYRYPLPLHASATYYSYSRSPTRQRVVSCHVDICSKVATDGRVYCYNTIKSR